MQSFLDIVSLKGLYGNKDLEELTAEYIVGIPEEKALRQWKKASQEERSEMKKAVGLSEIASFGDVRRASEPIYTSQEEHLLNVLNYAYINKIEDYPEEMCFHGEDVCVVSDSLELARVIAYLDSYVVNLSVLYFWVPPSLKKTITPFIDCVQRGQNEQGVRPIFSKVTVATEEDKKNCLTFSKLYDKLIKDIEESQQRRELGPPPIRELGPPRRELGPPRRELGPPPIREWGTRTRRTPIRSPPPE